MTEVNSILVIIPASVRRASSARWLLYSDLMASPRCSKVFPSNPAENDVSPLPNLGTSERPCTRPHGLPRDWTTRTYYYITTIVESIIGYARYTLTCASDRRWSLDRAWSDARSSWGRWTYIYNFIETIWYRIIWFQIKTRKRKRK